MKNSGKFKSNKKITRKQKEEEYELYKKAMENPDDIDPMTENSTDWAELERKYKDRYEEEKERNKIVLTDENGKKEYVTREELRERARKAFNENQNKIKTMVEEIKPKAVGSKKFSEYDLEMTNDEAEEFSDYLRNKYGTDDLRISAYDNKRNAQKIYSEFKDAKETYEKAKKEWINSPFGDDEERARRERAKNEARNNLYGKPARNMKESIEKNKSEVVKFNDTLERYNVRTFADDIELQEMSKMTNKELVEYQKTKGGFNTSDNAEFARVKELYYETGLAKYKEKMEEILKRHDIR